MTVFIKPVKNHQGLCSAGDFVQIVGKGAV